MQPTVGSSMASLSEDARSSGLERSWGVHTPWLEIGRRDVQTQGAALLYLLRGAGLSVWTPLLAAFNSNPGALSTWYLKETKSTGIKKGGQGGMLKKDI